MVGMAQMGPTARDGTREEVVKRMLGLLYEAADRGVELLVYPELALTTFFPRWFIEDEEEMLSYFETQMPSETTQPLFDEAARLGIGFCLGYAEVHTDAEGVTHRYNTQILVERDGSQVAKFRKIHIPGHAEIEEWRPFQHAERYFFEPGPDGFGVWRAFGGIVGMAICNDRRWSETYRVMGLQGVELILIGYNTPYFYAPDPQQNALQNFHSKVVMQAGAYQNGCWVVGVAKAGIEEGVENIAQSVIVAPSGQIVAQTITDGDELVVAKVDLDFCSFYKDTIFNFDLYRVPEHYRLISETRGVVLPPESE